MSAAATAAGYLYASGRLRGKSKEEEPRVASSERKRLRIAVLPDREAYPDAPVEPRPKRVPRIEYRVRRWRPE